MLGFRVCNVWGIRTTSTPNARARPEGDARCRVSQSLLRAWPSQPGWAHEPRLPRSPEDRTAKRPGCLFRSLFTKFQVRSYARGLGRPQRSRPRE